MTLTHSSVEAGVAIAAVRDASRTCRRVRAALLPAHAASKLDRSPVTVADLASQAIISLALADALPDDPVMGEEDDALVAGNWGSPIAAGVLHHVARIRPGVEAGQIAWALRRCSDAGGPRGRHWVVDPVDGTKGFLRGGQYAVALGLVEDGEVVLGVLGCPNLPVDPGDPASPIGCIFVAERGAGTWQVPLDDDGPDEGGDDTGGGSVAGGRAVAVGGFGARGGYPTSGEPGAGGGFGAGGEADTGGYDTGGFDPGGRTAGRGADPCGSGAGAGRPAARRVWVCDVVDAACATWVESLEPGHADQSTAAAIAGILGARGEPIRMDSQAKYAVVARGEASIYLRIQHGAYVENTWDHAAGSLLVTEAGGIVSDADGVPLDFGAGRRLAHNRGIVAAPAAIHGQVLAAVGRATTRPSSG